MKRDFSAERPNALWPADFSYLRCWEGVVFFSFVIDAFSRRIVGWQFASHMRTDLVLDALRMALTRRRAGADVPAEGFGKHAERPLHVGARGDHLREGAVAKQGVGVQRHQAQDLDVPADLDWVTGGRRRLDEAFVVVTFAPLEVVDRSMASPAQIEAPVQQGGLR